MAIILIMYEPKLCKANRFVIIPSIATCNVRLKSNLMHPFSWVSRMNKSLIILIGTSI
jgi:hypothetical protein